MKRVVGIVAALLWLGAGNIVCAKELLPWEIEHVSIAIPGAHSLLVDNHILSFEVPIEIPDASFRAKEVMSRGGKFDDWLKKNGEYEKDCFGEYWDFYPLGIPLFGISAQFSILAKLHVKTPPATRMQSYLYPDRGDFSKPEELFENLRRSTDFYVDKSKYDRSTHLLTYYSPVEEVVINGRRWYRYYWNNSAGPDDLREVYVTGLAPDRYLEIFVRQYPVPYPKSGYPTYPTEDQMPGWMKKTHKYKELVINSIRITKQAGSNESDLYEIEAAPPASEK